MNIQAFAKITNQHESILLLAFINKHTVTRLMFTIHVAISHTRAFHQLNLLVAVFGLNRVVQTRTGTNIHVVACAGQTITLSLSIHS